MRPEEIHTWLRAHLFDAVPVAISVIGPDFRIAEANEAFERTYGSWRGRQCYEVYKGSSTRCQDCAALDTFRDGQVRSREEAGPTRGNGPRHYLVQMVPIRREDGEIPYVIEMSTDITAFKRLEHAKREAERLAAVGQTVAGIAHGVKNVLMGLEGGMYAVNSGIERGDDERVARGWTMVQANVERISSFVKEFLDFAKGRQATVRRTDPAAPVHLVMDLLSERASGAGIRLHADVAAELQPAALDADGIYTCLANLVSNAIDACLLSEVPRAFEVLVSCSERDGVLTYEVRDNGHGMDAEISRKVFSQFFTTQGSDRGTGLGLLTTKKIVHQHGGRITFTSRTGTGSTFRIELPRADLPRPDEPPAEAADASSG